MADKEDAVKVGESKPSCGVVMPLSALDGCPKQHWLDVQGILMDAVRDAGFVASLVSDADDVGVIHKRIIQNLYMNDLVVCDVSGKNPNVMFELGMRLAFDKPTVIVKDDKTPYSFDTAPIEHLEYPRDLRYGNIVDFKASLAEKLRGTYQRAIDDNGYTTFLKNFGAFTVAKLDTTEVPKEQFIFQELSEIRHQLSVIRVRISSRRTSYEETQGRVLTDRCDGAFGPSECQERLLRALRHTPDIALAAVDRELGVSVSSICATLAKTGRLPPCFDESSGPCMSVLMGAVSEFLAMRARLKEGPTGDERHLMRSSDE